MNNETFNYIIERLLDDANDAAEAAKSDPHSEFAKGVKFAYCTALDTIRNELMVADYDLSECGLEADVIKKYM